MNLEKIKEKYKEILQESQLPSDHSEESWELAYSHLKHKRRKHILTQSQCLNRSAFSTAHNPHDQAVIKAKQQLAQALANITKKDKHIESLQSDLIKAKEVSKILESQIAELKKLANDNQQKLIEQKIAYCSIEQNMKNIQEKVHSQHMDKQLLQRQIQFYQLQIQNLKTHHQQKDQQLQQMKKQLKMVQKYKNISHKLKDDVTRLRQLLSETTKYHFLSQKIANKHYLKKSHKQHEHWVSADLIANVQHFLKKQQPQVPTNPDFTHNLIKFIAKYENQTKINTNKKIKKILTDKHKEQQRKLNHSLNLAEVRDEELKKSQFGNSLFKSRRNTLHDSKKTDSFIYDKLQKSLMNQSLSKNRQICIQILSSFRRSVVELTDTKQLKKKKLIKLVDWAIDSVLSLFPKQKPLPGLTVEPRMDSTANGDFRIQSDQIKITL